MVNIPKVAQGGPYPLEVTEGKKYAWCACGLSASQPLCDGSHAATTMTPVVFRAEKTETVWLCGCKRSQMQPFCDGSHSSL